MKYATIRKDLVTMGVPVMSPYGNSRYLYDDDFNISPARFIYQQPELLDNEEYNLIIKDPDGFVWFAMSIDFEFIEDDT
jgi:hypothetical protein